MGKRVKRSRTTSETELPRELPSNEAEIPNMVDEKFLNVESSISADDEDDREVMIWNPECELTEKQINDYLAEARKNNIPIEKALEVLSFFNYDLKKATEFCSDFVVPDLFSDAEKLVVRSTAKLEHFRLLTTQNKFFPLKRLLSRQTSASFTEYYYRNKQHDFTFIPRKRRAVKKVEVASDENERPKRPCSVKPNHFLRRRRTSSPSKKRKPSLKPSQRKTKRRSV